MSPGNSNQDKMLQGNTQYAVTHIMGPILGPLFYFSFEGCCVIFLKKMFPGLQFSFARIIRTWVSFLLLPLWDYFFWEQGFQPPETHLPGELKIFHFLPFHFFFLFRKRFLCFPGPCYRFLRHVQSVFLHACGCLNGGIILKGKSQTKDLEIRAQRGTQPHEWNGPHPAKSPKSYPRFPWMTCV